MKALDEYDMIQPGDKIAVGISGGKDSLVMAKLFQQLSRFTKIPFQARYIAMDPGYSKENRDKLEAICQYLDLPLEVYESDIFEVTQREARDNPCYLCARMRRGFLYSKARDLGCNKLALGHHFNDVIETIMLNVLWSGTFKTMMPKLKSKNFEGLELIRPLYLVEERNIKSWMDYVGISPMDEACPIVEFKKESQRENIKDLIEELKKTNPNVENHIFKSAENVALGAILGWEYEGQKHFFLDDYDDRS